MADIFVGSVSVGVVPDARGWDARLSSQLAPSADRIGREYGARMGSKITESMGKTGEASGGAFETAFRKRVKAALDALPRDATGPIAQLRAKLEEIYRADIIDPKRAVRQLGEIDAALKGTALKAKDIRVSFDTKEARAQLALLKRDVSDVGERSKISGLLSGASGLLGRNVIGPIPLGVAAPAAAGIAALLPFIGQALGGTLIAGLGSGLAGLGIAGALYTGGGPPKVPAAPVAPVEPGPKATAAAREAYQIRLKNYQTQLQAYQTAQQEYRQYQKTYALQLQAHAAFGQLTTDAKKSLSDIGAAFAPVLLDVFKVADKVLQQMTPVFVGVEQQIAGPFQKFADTFIKSFASPAVQQSIEAVAGAFISILNALTPAIPAMFDQIASAITQIAQTIAQHPQSFVNFVKFLIDVGVFALNVVNVLAKLPPNLILGIAAAITAVVVAVKLWSIAQAFLNLLLDANPIGLIIIAVAALVVGIIILVKNWHQVWTNIKNWTVDAWHGIYNEVLAPMIRFFTQTIPGWWDAIKSAWSKAWDLLKKAFLTFILYDILTPLGWIIDGAAKAFGWIPGIGGKLKDAAKHFDDFKTSVNNSLAGINDQTVNVSVRMTAATNPYPGGISGRAQHGLYIGSGAWGHDDQLIMAQRGELVVPASMVAAGMVDHLRGSIPGFAAGGQVGVSVNPTFPAMSALDKMLMWNVTSLAGDFAKAFTAAAVKAVGSGVAQWASTVMQALSMLGLPLSLASLVLYQMQTESGGNPNAINLWDINAQHGDPSRGLMQVIGATFAAYHVPGTSFNIYDPLANIAAALNYASHNRGFGSGPGQLGSGHGYDNGGLLPPGLTLAVNRTGRSEIILTQDQFSKVTRGSDGVAYHAHFDGLTGAAIEQHVQTAFQAMSLTQGYLNRQGRRSLCLCLPLLR